MPCRCIVLDGGAAKAIRVLRARLAPLGVTIKPAPHGLPDFLVDALARVRGCVVVSTDRDGHRYGWVVVEPSYAARKSARDLASHIIKLTCAGGERRR